MADHLIYYPSDIQFYETVMIFSGSRPRAIGFFLLSACLVIPLLSGCSEEKEVVKEELIRPVRYLVAKPDSNVRLYRYPGTARAKIESKQSFRVPGLVTQVAVEVGDHIKKGDLVAQLEQADYQLRLKSAKAGLEQAQANAENARLTLARIKGLYDQGNASISSLDDMRSKKSAIDAGVRAAKSQLELARRQLGYTQLRSPADCLVAMLNTEANENVAAGQVLSILNCGNEVEITTAVPATLIQKLNKTVEAQLQFSALGDQAFIATVNEIGIAATEFGTMYPVTLSLKTETVQIQSGMSAQVIFQMPEIRDTAVYSIPLSAVSEDSNGRFIYLAEPKKEAGYAEVKRVNVKIGRLSSSDIEIINGLSSGDRVITAGVSRIHPGQTVKLKRMSGK